MCIYKKIDIDIGIDIDIDKHIDIDKISRKFAMNAFMPIW